jgi:hypothetical protein
MPGNYRVYKQLGISRVVLSSIELVSWLDLILQNDLNQNSLEAESCVIACH